MPEADGTVSEHHHRHRRRRTKRTGLGTADVGRTVFWIMVALSLAAMAFSAHRMRLASLMAGPLLIGADCNEGISGGPARRSRPVFQGSILGAGPADPAAAQDHIRLAGVVEDQGLAAGDGLLWGVEADRE